MAQGSNQLLGQILKNKGVITEDELQAGLREQENTRELLGRVLTRLGYAEESDILKALSEQLDIPYVRIEPGSIDPALIRQIPAKIVTHYQLMPVSENNGTLTIATNDPLDINILDELEFSLKRSLKQVIAGRDEIIASIKQYYGIGAETIEKMMAENTKEIEVVGADARKDEDVEDQAMDASVIKFVNQILLEAIRDRATDIHIEPFENVLRIRYRIDGLLYEAAIPPTIKHFQSAIVSRIKIMAELNIAEKRLPQDGRIKIRMAGEEFDLRVSILPTPYGEMVVIRILSRSNIFFNLEELGLAREDLRVLDMMIKRPHGIILVTGPTGSGKTTTLYATLSKINSMDRKIITIEDPIEYQLEGIGQMQVQPKIGFTFANALRSMLRHDPDIMLVGEIRDLETAEIASRTALTGHLVFSTLHTNDSSSAITRLIDMGIDAYLISSSVEAIIAQRLVRLICHNCKEEFTPGEEALREMGMSREEVCGITFLRGRGCEECRNTGYKGRSGIYEILVLTPEIKELVFARAPSSAIKQKAIGSGMKTLRKDGWEKVSKGLTTIEEVLRVTQEDELAE